ncbi:MAG TPA: CCA tRNA nucleotidyltransferase [Candidatus Limnocylindria bacterium]|nr:CCA tRNA nucleotidyltransferase [Candidatus Limnocylindria bacterium]
MSVRDGDELVVAIPPSVRRVLRTLRDAGHEAALVGGCVRDVVRGETSTDWDVATSGPPEAVAALFPGSSWENRFGTVTVTAADGGGPAVEATTYRVEGPYLDGRRPAEVRWGTSLHGDLSRRDFTINAMAWVPSDPATMDAGTLVDPFHGADDLRAGVLRAVGDADERFAEDALRLVRAVRFAVRFDLRLDPATERAIRRNASAAAALSGERVRDELTQILRGQAPSRAFALMESLGLLDVLLPELAALRGVPQAKSPPGDALDHSLRTVDALPAHDPALRMAGLLHDLGKATTLADGHFIGHEREGAQLAERVLRRLRTPNADLARITALIRHHMFAYAPAWTDAAVRRFVRRVGEARLDDLFSLRAADNLASGAREPATGGLDELRARARHVVEADPIRPGQLAVDGHDLMRELGIEPGPLVGRLLAQLFEAVLDAPELNKREALLRLARERAASASGGAAAHRQAGASSEAGE